MVQLLSRFALNEIISFISQHAPSDARILTVAPLMTTLWEPDMACALQEVQRFRTKTQKLQPVLQLSVVHSLLQGSGYFNHGLESHKPLKISELPYTLFQESSHMLPNYTFLLVKKAVSCVGNIKTITGPSWTFGLTKFPHKAFLSV